MTSSSNSDDSEDDLASKIVVMQRLNFTHEQIASTLGIATSTLTKKKRQLGIFKYAKDVESSSIKKSIKHILVNDNDQMGWKMMQGYLKAQYNLSIGRPRLRQLLKECCEELEIDRHNAFGEGQPFLVRRQYRNDGSNDVWHVDFHDKLSPWNIYVHGCIDGNSRYLVWLFVTTTHASTKVYELFKQSVEQLHALPNAIRSDKGKESVLMAFANLLNNRKFYTGKYLLYKHMCK
jgi:hypothetical protein